MKIEAIAGLIEKVCDCDAGDCVVKFGNPHVKVNLRHIASMAESELTAIEQRIAELESALRGMIAICESDNDEPEEVAIARAAL